MKKLTFLILFIIVYSFSIAQKFHLEWSKGKITNGSAITVKGNVNEDIVLPVTIVNDSGKPINIRVRKVDKEAIEGTGNVFCIHACFPPNIYFPQDSIYLESFQKDSTSFYADYFPNGIIGTSTIEYHFINTFDNDSIVLIAKYEVEDTGISDIFSSEKLYFSLPYPNPAKDYFSIDYNIGDKNRDLFMAISNLDGKINKKINSNICKVYKFLA